MKKVAYLILTGIILVTCNQQPVKEKKEVEETKTVSVNSEPVRDGVFIHISEGYDDPHRVLMPMKMATIMAEDKDVLIYMDIHAVNLTVKGAKDVEHKGFDSFQTYLNKLSEMDVEVYACPTCLEVAGFAAEDLIEKIKPADKERFFNSTEARIITLDY